MPGKRCESMDLPVPGGPIINKLCPPAAAISKARRAVCWPLTSAKSGILLLFRRPLRQLAFGLCQRFDAV